jgi:hypothetical protein
VFLERIDSLVNLGLKKTAALRLPFQMSYAKSELRNSREVETMSVTETRYRLSQLYISRTSWTTL